MARLSDFLDAHKRTNTQGVTATAADIRRGRRAFANGSEIIGSADLRPIGSPYNNDVLLLIQPPVGVSVGSGYNIITHASNGVLIRDSRLTELSNPFTFTLNSSGYFYNASNYANSIVCSDAPRQKGLIRKYEMWGTTKNATPTTNDGVRLWINTQHEFNQSWVIDLYWTGSVWRLDLTEWNNPSAVVRGSASFSSVVDWPFIWHLTVYTMGDRIHVVAGGYESDSVADSEIVNISYSVANRPYKDATAFSVANRNTPGDEWPVRGLCVMDIV